MYSCKFSELGFNLVYMRLWLCWPKEAYYFYFCRETVEITILLLHIHRVDLVHFEFITRCFGVWYRCRFLRVVYCFLTTGLVRQVKIQATSRNIQRYPTPKRLIGHFVQHCFFPKCVLYRNVATFIEKYKNERKEMRNKTGKKIKHVCKLMAKSSWSAKSLI